MSTIAYFDESLLSKTGADALHPPARFQTPLFSGTPGLEHFHRRRTPQLHLLPAPTMALGAPPPFTRQIGASAEPTFKALFNADIAKSVLEHFWARLPLTYKSDRLRPEDLLAALAYSGKGTIKIGKLLQQLGCAVLVGSVGIRGPSAALSRHCSPSSWQRYERELRRQALSRFELLRMKSFHAAEKPSGQVPFKTRNQVHE